MSSSVFTLKYFYCFEGNIGNMAVTSKRPHRQRANMCHLFCFLYNVVSENYSVQNSPWGWVGGRGRGLWPAQGQCNNDEVMDLNSKYKWFVWGWSGGAKVSCILRHRGVQLILAYNWARPVTLVAGKGRGGMLYFFCFFTFILVRLSYLSLSFISSTISSISFLPFSRRRHKMTHKG